MSVTFSLPNDYCQVGGDSDAEARYFEAKSSIDGEFNIANANAAWLLREVLNIRHEDEETSIPVYMAQARLNAFTSPDSGVEKPTVETGIMIDANGVGPGVRVFSQLLFLIIDSYSAGLI